MLLSGIKGVWPAPAREDMIFELRFPWGKRALATENLWSAAGENVPALSKGVKDAVMTLIRVLLFFISLHNLPSVPASLSSQGKGPGCTRYWAQTPHIPPPGEADMRVQFYRPSH